MLRSFAPCLLVLCLIAPEAAADTVTGTVVDPNGVGVAGVTLGFDNASPLNPITGVGGFFSLTVPAGTYEITFNPPGGSTLAPHLLTGVTVAGVANLGTIALAIGFDLQGTVRTPTGAAIVGGDIDVFDVASGAKLFTPNDATDALGQFAVTVAAGSYRVRMEPVPGQLLVAQSINVVVTGNTSIGIVVLPTGVLLSGTVRAAQTSFPAVDVDIDVFDHATGVRIETPNDDTDSLGQFAVVVPIAPVRVTFEARIQDRLAATEIEFVNVTGSTNIGIINLAAGALISGIVRGIGGQPLADVDTDFDMVAGDVRLFTPGDSTDASGAFNVVVPLTNLIVTAVPDFASQLVAAEIGPFNVTADINVGIIQLASGVVLSGTVTGFAGAEPGCRVTVTGSTSGQEIPTPNSFTSPTGAYGVVVPAGTYNVDFAARKTSLSKDRVFTNVSVVGPTTLNAALTTVPMFTYVEDPASPEPQVVPSGSPLLVTILWFNTNPVLTGFANVDIQLVNPFGVAVNMFPTFLLPLNPFQALFGIAVPLQLPPANPAHLGLHQRFRIVLTDPANGAEIDRDEMRFIRT